MGVFITLNEGYPQNYLNRGEAQGNMERRRVAWGSKGDGPCCQPPLCGQLVWPMDPRLWVLPVASEGGLSCGWGCGQQEHEMRHCWELCRANGREEDEEKRRNEGNVREVRGEAGRARTEGTVAAAEKAHAM